MYPRPLLEHSLEALVVRGHSEEIDVEGHWDEAMILDQLHNWISVPSATISCGHRCHVRDVNGGARNLGACEQLTMLRGEEEAPPGGNCLTVKYRSNALRTDRHTRMSDGSDQ